MTTTNEFTYGRPWTVNGPCDSLREGEIVSVRSAKGNLHRVTVGPVVRLPTGDVAFLADDQSTAKQETQIARAEFRRAEMLERDRGREAARLARSYEKRREHENPGQLTRTNAERAARRELPFVSWAEQDAWLASPFDLAALHARATEQGATLAPSALLAWVATLPQSSLDLLPVRGFTAAGRAELERRKNTAPGT